MFTSCCYYIDALAVLKSSYVHDKADKISYPTMIPLELDADGCKTISRK